MAALNSNLDGAFLLYLTVFRSRLGVANIVLPLSGLAYMPMASLLSRLTGKLSETVSLDTAEPESQKVFQYLIEKKLISQVSGRFPSRGRYKDYVLKAEDGFCIEQRSGGSISNLPIFLPDVWMAEPSLPSTIGVPTPENSQEALGLCHQLGLISKTKNVWTAAGQLVTRLRERFSGRMVNNPFVLGAEGVVLLRQVLEKDGLMLRELLREFRKLDEPFSRDDAAQKLPVAARRAYEQAKSMHLPSAVLANTRKHVLGLEKYTEKSAVARPRNAAGAKERLRAQRGPGVLEHRTAARLEWLVDLGFLTKGSEPKNAFVYFRAQEFDALCALVDEMSGQRNWVDDTTISLWRFSSRWNWVRRLLPSLGVRESLLLGYRLMRRVVGPASIRDVVFAAALFERDQTLMPSVMQGELVRWAAESSKLTLSGGTYSRTPELIHIADEMLGEEVYGTA